MHRSIQMFVIRTHPYLLACLALSITTTPAADIDGKVVSVNDGDTVRVLDSAMVEHRVRLTGIDAPEKGQPFGTASRRHLASLVAGKPVLVESAGSDRYGRLLGKVWVRPDDCPDCGRTLDANLAQIQAGMAWWYQYYADDQPPGDRESYQSAAMQAKRLRLGLWSEADAIPPWAWRRGERPRHAAAANHFDCGGKRYCREMSSCEEARFHLRHCGLTSLDGDGDGRPCESICR